MTFETMLALLAGGMGNTFLIFALTLILSLPLGWIVYFGRQSSFAPLAWITKVFIAVMRGTPLVLQLMVWYFGPYYLFGIPTTLGYKFWAVIIGFTVNYAAYFAEIYRGGVLSIPKGQYEAASVLGYSRSKAFIRIILPQVIRTVLPSVTNEIITLVKDTSIAYVIGVEEMFTKAKAIVAGQTTLMPFVIAAVFYFVFNYIVSFTMERIEKAFAKRS